MFCFVLQKKHHCALHVNYRHLSSFIPCHRKYSQSEYRKAVVYSTVLNSTFPSLRSYYRRNLVSDFSMTWYKIVMQHFLMVYHGFSLVFSWYTLKKFKWFVGIPWYATRKRCISSIFSSLSGRA